MLLACVSVLMNLGNVAVVGTVIAFGIMAKRKRLGASLFILGMSVPFVPAGLYFDEPRAFYHVFAILALPVIWWAPDNFRFRINSYVWRLFYPLHWYLLTLGKALLGTIVISCFFAVFV